MGSALEDLRKRVNQVQEGKVPDPTETDVMVTHEARTVGVKVKELREAIESNPEHPVAKVIEKGIRNYNDEETLYMEAPDVQALLEDKDVEIVRDGLKSSKKLVDRKREEEKGEDRQPKAEVRAGRAYVETDAKEESSESDNSPNSTPSVDGDKEPGLSRPVSGPGGMPDRPLRTKAHRSSPEPISSQEKTQ